MKAGWQVRALGEVATIVNGGTPKSGTAAYWDGAVNWLTPKDMGQLSRRRISETPRKITDAGLKNSSARLVPPTSVIMSTRAPIGHLAINEAPMAFNQGCRGIVPGEAIDTDFIYYFLAMNRERLNELGTGATFRELSSSALKSFPVPLPPLEEQRRIVAILDEAFEGLDRARDNAEANLAGARELFQSQIDQTFCYDADAPAATLADHIDISHGLAFDGADFDLSNDETKPIILTPGNYTEDATLSFSVKNTKRLAAPPPPKYIFRDGDLTVVMTDLSSKMKILGLPAFVSESNILHNQRIGRVVIKSEKMLARWIYYFLQTRSARASIISTATGTMVRHTAPKRILSLKVPLPNLAEQANGIDRLDAARAEFWRLRDNYGFVLDSIADLRQSLLHTAFAGELT